MKKNDFELVKEKNYVAILEKYKPLISKYYYRMIKVNGKAYEDVNDFIADFYPELVKAVDAIKFEKIKSPENFILYKQLSFYLQNHTTRCLKHTIKQLNTEQQFPEKFDAKYDDNSYERTERLQSFDEIYTNYLNDEQRLLVDKVLSGIPAYKVKGFDKVKRIFKEKMEI